MKNLKIIVVIALVAFAISGCKKDDSNSNNFLFEEGVIAMELDGKNFKSTSIEKFEELADTVEWNFNQGGTLEIDTVNTFNGNSSLKLISTNYCFNLEKTVRIHVSEEKVSVIHFNYRMPVTTIEDLNNGFGSTCMRST